MSTENTPQNERLSIPEVAAALHPYGVTLAESHLSDISHYVQTLLKWNKMINLTALEDPAEIVAKHFGESIFAASVIPEISGRLADVGTGAGFPGLPLKIAFPGINLLLIEPNNKKCAFLTEITQELGLVGVEIYRARYEETVQLGQKLDYVCSRALGNYRHLLRWAKTTLKLDGKVVLWVGTDDSTLIGQTKGWIWRVPTPIPNSLRRVILVGKPIP